jgi:hypothetical protein
MMDEIIREATLMDTVRIVDMGRDFLIRGPYKDMLTDNPSWAVKFVMGLINNPSAKVLVATNNNRVMGVIAFVIIPHYLSGDLTASELIWYVEPGYRGQVSLELFWAAQKLAKQMGAVNMQFTAPTEAIGAIYRRFGYKQMEVSYQRSL